VGGRGGQKEGEGIVNRSEKVWGLKRSIRREIFVGGKQEGGYTRKGREGRGRLAPAPLVKTARWGGLRGGYRQMRKESDSAELGGTLEAVTMT